MSQLSITWREKKKRGGLVISGHVNLKKEEVEIYDKETTLLTQPPPQRQKEGEKAISVRREAQGEGILR